MSGKQSPSGGVKAFCIAGGLERRRERLKGMTDDERRWRAQFLKDQELSPEEPRFVPEYYKSTTNIIKRILQFPGSQYENLLTPLLGKTGAQFTRLATGSVIKFIASIYAVAYVLKYHSNDYTKYRSVEVCCSRPLMYPDEPNYPNFKKKKTTDFCNQGFYSSVLCVEVEPPPPPPPPAPEIKLPPDCDISDSQE